MIFWVGGLRSITALLMLRGQGLESGKSLYVMNNLDDTIVRNPNQTNHHSEHSATKLYFGQPCPQYDDKGPEDFLRILRVGGAACVLPLTTCREKMNGTIKYLEAMMFPSSYFSKKKLTKSCRQSKIKEHAQGMTPLHASSLAPWTVMNQCEG